MIWTWHLSNVFRLWSVERCNNMNQTPVECDHIRECGKVKWYKHDTCRMCSDYGVCQGVMIRYWHLSNVLKLWSVARCNDMYQTTVEYIHITLKNLHCGELLSRKRFWLIRWMFLGRISACTPLIWTVMFSTHWSVTPRTVQSGNFKRYRQ